jgi:hypothetical protein
MTFLYLSILLTGGAADLGSDDFDAREQASRRLTAHGVLALPVLWDAERSADAEVRRRAEEVESAVLPAWTRRLRPLYRAWALIHDGDGPLDAFQLEELREGGAAVFLDVLDVAEAEGLVEEGGYGGAATRRNIIRDGKYCPDDAVAALQALREASRPPSRASGRSPSGRSLHRASHA